MLTILYEDGCQDSGENRWSWSSSIVEELGRQLEIIFGIGSHSRESLAPFTQIDSIAGPPYGELENGKKEMKNDESEFTSGFPLHLLTFGLCLTAFAISLDNTITGTATPRMTSDIGFLENAAWYSSAYSLTMPSLAKFYTFFNVKILYIISLAIFEAGSVVCGAAQNPTMLIIGRAIAGLGASGLFSGTMTIIAYSVPLRKRPMYIAVVTSMFSISSVTGPVLAGVFTDRLSWRWCFYINLPIGAITIVTVFFFFKSPDRKEEKLGLREKILQLDPLGAALLISAVVSLLIALQWGGTIYAWTDSKVWGCFLSFGILILLFIYVQYRIGDHATIPPRILCGERATIGVVCFSFFTAMGLYTQLFYIPLYFQAVKGTSAQDSGIYTIPFIFGNTISSVLVGCLVTRLGLYTPFIWVASAMYTVGSGLLYMLKIDSSPCEWVMYQLVTGIGSGPCIQLPLITLQATLAKESVASGSTFGIFFSTFGGAIGVTIAQNIFSNQLAEEIPKHTVGIDPAAIIAVGAANFREVTPPDQLAGILLAYNIAITDTFILAIACGGLVFLLGFLIEWKNIKRKDSLQSSAA